jgi:GNAT superfamily N-acetyltransferase
MNYNVLLRGRQNMPDMLVRLYDMPEINEEKRLADEGICIKRAMALDKTPIIEFIRANFETEGWASECEKAIFTEPSSCYIAVRNGCVVGFACYDATGRGFFGPTGTAESERGKGIGKALLGRCLLSMREKGYGYAIIGYVTDAVGFYKKAVNATVIDGTDPGKSIYKNLISE